ncbi:MAG: DMT family transporter [Arenicellales bacterium]
MLEYWIPITIAAAFFQNVRSALQKHLQGRLSTVGAGYSRFLYALPVAALYLWFIAYITGQELPPTNIKFLIYCFLGGICQIMFTVFLLWMFSFQSFAVGTTFSKLEVVMVAILGALILQDLLNIPAIVAIVVSALGVFALSLGQSKLSIGALVAGLFRKPTLIGLICAAWLGGSVVFFRGASLSLDHHSFTLSAAFTLFISLMIQNIIMGGYLLMREPGEFGRVLTNWRWAGAAGVMGAFASICWFTAFTVQNASYVRALGQIELLFTFIATTVVFREKVSPAELVGIFLVCAGILILLLWG